jgi:hypothetical protein
VQVFIRTKVTVQELAIFVATLHVIITLGQGTTENHFTISGNTCAKIGITTTNTSKLYQAIYSVNISTRGFVLPLSVLNVSARFYSVDVYCKTNTCGIFYNIRKPETDALLRRSVASNLKVSTIPYCPTDHILPYSIFETFRIKDREIDYYFLIKK